jgi:phage shock protein PspC (stress-responsive transcriptional regulator)
MSAGPVPDHDVPMADDDTRTTPQPSPTAAPGAYPPVATLRRSRGDRKVAGVAGGLGRYAGVDPLVFRILFVVLAIFGGSGILLYALGWLLIPDEGSDESEGQRLFGGGAQGAKASLSTVVALVIVLVVGLVAVGSLLGTGPGLGGLGALVIVAVILVLLLNRGARPEGAAASPGTTAYGPVPPPTPGTYGQTTGTAYAATAAGDQDPPVPPPYAPPLPAPPPGRPRERSVLGRVTFFSALVVVGLMLAWNSVSSNDFTAVAVLASALAVVGIGLLVGAFAGRGRWLILLGIVLSLVTSAKAAAEDHFSGGVGERDWRPLTVAAAERPFHLGVGEGRLDLTGLPAGSDVDVEVRLGVGELRITVPADARVVVDGQVGAGTMKVLDAQRLDGTDLAGRTTHDPVEGVTASGSTITIDVEVGLGDLEVRR